MKIRFNELANHPMLYSAVDQIKKGYCCSVFGFHSIYYWIEKRDVEIVRTLAQQDNMGAFSG